jgi:NADH:ubiquinone oxidoreductase subunit E
MANHKKKDDIILALHQAQEDSANNCIKPEKLKEIAREFNIPFVELSGLLSFYTMFSSKPRGKFIIRVCDSLPCRISGSVDIYLYLQERLGIKNGETTPDGNFTLEVVNCLGACDKAPNVMINETLYSNLNPETMNQILKKLEKKEIILEVNHV